MIIKSMDASFGGLENAHMELDAGLNIIEAPNEAGKSTWCGFIRTMLYGINTSQRVSAGVLPDKKRFLPWGSYPMRGSMRIQWRGGDVTLSRSGAAGKPMGNCDAKISDTAQKVPELCGKAPGETILGVPESVFRRSAFISGSALTVDKDSELEKRISALITSGSEEDESYSTARSALHNWRVKRKHNSRVGRAAELESKIAEKNDALAAIKEENARLGGIHSERTALLGRIESLEAELRRHEGAKLKAEYDKIAAARAAHAEAEAEYKRLSAEAGELSSEKLTAARNAVSEYREAAAKIKTAAEAEARYNEAKSDCEKAETELREAQREAAGVTEAGIAAARKALLEYESAEANLQKTEENRFEPKEQPPAKKAPVALLAAGIVLIVLGAAALALQPIITPVAAAIGIALLAIFFVKKQRIARDKAAAEEAERAERAVYDNLLGAARSRMQEAEQALLDALAAIGGETVPSRAAARIAERESLLEKKVTASAKLEIAERVAAGLAPEKGAAAQAADREEAAAQKLTAALEALGVAPTGNILNGIEEKAALLERLNRARADYTAAAKLAESLGELPELPEDTELPESDRDDVLYALESARRRAAELERALAVSEGELRHLGDPLVTATELENLREAYAANEEEYEALSLAMSVLDEANAELQQRFSPIVGSLAGKLMAAMTDGVYDKVSFDREFNFTAARTGEGEHASEYLSTGTAAQLYLAVRLAICMLALPEEESCPIILDDALLGFDDKRAKAALELLQELAKERQIILFTCQSRERMLLGI